MRCFYLILLAVFCAGSGFAAERPEDKPGGAPPLQVDRIFDELRDARDELKLNRDQDALWIEAEKTTRAALVTTRQNRQKLIDLYAAESGKEVMDIERIAHESDLVSSDNAKQRLVVREKWLQLFRSLSNDQKALASRRIRDRLQRMRALRERAMLPGLLPPGPP